MRKALALALTIMVLLTFVVSPVAAGMFDRKATWEKYKYRCGDGNMGWLRTPDFKNGGFETGNSAFWKSAPVGFNIWKPNAGTDTITAHSGEYCGAWYSFGYAGDLDVYQYVSMTSATGASFWVKVPSLTLDGNTLYLRVYIDDVKVYEEEITTTFDYKEIIIPLSYYGVHEFRVNANFSNENVFAILVYDDFKLLGPGF